MSGPTVEVIVCVAGQEIAPRRAGACVPEQIAAALAGSIRREVSQRLAALCCPVHGAAPSVRAEGPSFTTVQYTVTGCCAQLTEAARRRLR